MSAPRKKPAKKQHGKRDPAPAISQGDFLSALKKASRKITPPATPAPEGRRT